MTAMTELVTASGRPRDKRRVKFEPPFPINGRQWRMLIATHHGLVVSSDLGSVFLAVPNRRLVNVTPSAKAMLDKGLVAPWSDLEVVSLTPLGRLFIERKFGKSAADLDEALRKLCA